MRLSGPNLFLYFTVKESEAPGRGVTHSVLSDTAGSEHRFKSVLLPTPKSVGLHSRPLFLGNLLDQKSDSPGGLLALGETETMMEVSWASMLLLARHTYSPESATDIWCSRSREAWAWEKVGDWAGTELRSAAAGPLLTPASLAEPAEAVSSFICFCVYVVS